MNLKLNTLSILNYYCYSLSHCYYYYCNFSSVYISLKFAVHFTLEMAEATAETSL